MIFVTVGAQMPFDRLIRAVDEWAGNRGRQDVFAQIGRTALRPENIEWTGFLEPAAFREKVEEADVIVAHAGVGTILTALEFGKPALVMPRRADLKETRNDHQSASASHFEESGELVLARDHEELIERLDMISNMKARPPIEAFAPPQILEAIRTFINDG